MSKALRRFYRDVDGILLLDKALGVSSNAALQQVRALFGAAKAGHAGSLDPLASGLLPVCFGQATKVCGRLLNSGKTYRVLVQLGERTESGDGETEVIERAPVPPLTIARRRRGAGGVPRRAAAGAADALGAEVRRQAAVRAGAPRRVGRARAAHDRHPSHRARAARSGRPQLEFDVYCSKGTYIRTLAADIAVRARHARLCHRACAACRSIPFGDLPMYTLDAAGRPSRRQARDALLLAVGSRPSLDLPRVELDRGRRAEPAAGTGPSPRGSPPRRANCGLTATGGRFLGHGARAQPDGRVKPVRLFVDVEAGRRRGLIPGLVLLEIIGRASTMRGSQNGTHEFFTRRFVRRT